MKHFCLSMLYDNNQDLKGTGLKSKVNNDFIPRIKITLPDCDLILDKARHRKDLVKEIKCKVDSITDYVIDVKTNTIVKQLDFPKLLPLDSGDKITAYVFLGQLADPHLDFYEPFHEFEFKGLKDTTEADSQPKLDFILEQRRVQFLEVKGYDFVERVAGKSLTGSTIFPNATYEYYHPFVFHERPLTETEKPFMIKKGKGVRYLSQEIIEEFDLQSLI